MSRFASASASASHSTSRYIAWLNQFFINEPLNILEEWWGSEIGDSAGRLRIRSWSTRSPVVDLIIERTPQTLWVVGMSYVVGILIAIPIGVISAYRQYSWFDQAGTLFSMIGFSVPTFFTGLVLIVIFSTLVPSDSWLWLPSIYDTTHRVMDWDSFVYQVRQMVMPVMVLALFNAAQISRFMRSSMLDNLNQDYVRTARAKGMKEHVVVLVHVLRNSLIPVGHGDCARRAPDLRRRHHHRADLPCERARRAVDRRNRGGRHSPGPDPDLHIRGVDRGLQPDRRSPLRHSRPENPL